MFETTIDTKHNVIIATAGGTLSEADFEGLSESINEYINTTDHAPGLVLHAAQFPHWKNAAAMMAHFKLVHDHQKILPKVALVSDNSTLASMPTLVDFFVQAKIRHFQEKDFDKAVSWVCLADDDRPSVRLIEGLPADVLAYELVGTLTSRDYEEILDPVVKDKLERHDKLKVLVVAGDGFDGATAGALWDDARLGLRHLTGFSKIALVSDVKWLRQASKLFGPMMPGQLHVFDLAQRDEAITWIKS